MQNLQVKQPKLETGDGGIKTINKTLQVNRMIILSTTADFG